MHDRLCNILSAPHVLAGFDTTSHICKKGMVGTFKKLKNHIQHIHYCNLVIGNRNLSDKNLINLKEFIGILLNDAKPNESYVEV